MIICYVISLIMFVTGIMFFNTKAKEYINGYKNLSNNEKSKIDIKNLCRNISILFFLSSIIWGLAGYSEVFKRTYLVWSVLIWIVICILNIIIINKFKLYIKK